MEHGDAGVQCDVSLVRAFQFLGKRWNGVLLACLIEGPLTYTQLKRSVEGISDSVLAERLVELANAGLVDRSVDTGPPVAVSYALTGNGRALSPALHELARWAGENLDESVCARVRTARPGARSHGRQPE